MRKVEVSNGELMSPSQVDNDSKKFHRVGGWRSSQNDVRKVVMEMRSQVDNDS